MSEPDRARIAIALVALKHKPKDQTIASYLLDLQSRFPLVTEQDSRDWRTYALELEKQLAAVKAQRDVDQELISRLHTDATSTSDGPPPKKKSKKNPTKDQFDPQWTWDQCRADSRNVLSQFPWSPSLVAAYAALKGALASPSTDLLSHASRLTDATLRALDTIHLFLFSPPNPTQERHLQTALETKTPSQLKAAHIDSTRMALASPLLMYVLRTALPTLVRTVHGSTKSKRPRLRPLHATTSAPDPHALVDKVVDRLLESVLFLVRAITPLCFARLAPLITEPVLHKKGKGKGKAGGSVGKTKDKDKCTHPTPADARTDVFALIGTSLEALDALPPGIVEAGGIASGIRDRLGLETIRELEALYDTVQAPPSGAAPAGNSEEEAAATALPTPTPTPTSLLDGPSQARTEPLAKRLERLTGTRTDRVRALATKDAGWFLASTLNMCVTPTPTLSTHGPMGHRGPGLGLLRDAVLDRIGKLVRSLPMAQSCLGAETDRSGDDDTNATARLLGDPMNKFQIDPVCENLLLAICERALSQLAPL